MPPAEAATPHKRRPCLKRFACDTRAIRALPELVLSPGAAVTLRWDGDDDVLALAQLLRVRGETDIRGLEIAAERFASAVDSLLKFLDAARVDVEADHGDMSGERHSQRQADIAKADNGNCTLNFLHNVCGQPRKN